MSWKSSQLFLFTFSFEYLILRSNADVMIWSVVISVGMLYGKKN